MISIEGLWFRYGRGSDAVLRDVSTEIPQGSITAILGPNGSGKTTLLSILLGLLTPEKGTLRIDGRTIDEYSRATLSQMIGLVPQQEFFPLGFSVLDYVLLGRAPYLGLLERPGPEDYAVAEGAIAQVRIESLRERLVPSLSGGERQLTTVARALAQCPRILLMDEPTSHLDLANKRRVMGVIRGLADEGVTIIMTTHDPNAAAANAEYLVLMREGRVVKNASLSEALTAENLSYIYGVPVQVGQLDGHLVVFER
ncbi:MAG: hypothetical protein A2Y73_03325 [Chloroflexi bacterium RBG_13_56_8]|nr:MAG: hypothetical protein A2Y73_03325 [Chloroflexi bacterium RBG_13_56_8]